MSLSLNEEQKKYQKKKNVTVLPNIGSLCISILFEEARK